MSHLDDLAGSPVGGNWWQRRSLRLRLAVSFTLIASAILLALLPAVYSLIRRQMGADMDRQLRIDWALIEAHLENDGDGGIQWRKSSPATPESPGYAESWFDVWRGEAGLLKHWPVHGAEAVHPPNPEKAEIVDFSTVLLNGERPARTFQKPTTISGLTVSLRVFRDESGHRSTLRRIFAGLALGMPFAVVVAAFAAYLMAGRALRPVGEMAAEARQITSESLGKRLPNPNPHDELGQLATVFNETIQRLEGSFDSLKRFTADASHELRTPLTALRAVGEIAMREEREPEVLRETIGSMLEEAQRLNDLTDTLLMLARVESGRLPARPETLAIDALVREVCDSLEVLATEKRQRIEIATAPGLIVNADRVLLRQAVMNILHNAICYSPPDSTVRVVCFARGNEAVVEIADEGPGIAPEHREKVFERFYRIDKARSRAEGGAGLGLALAKLFVEQVGGAIELEADRGSTFRIRIPSS
jgi:two-component system OmpR family sensor kinase